MVSAQRTRSNHAKYRKTFRDIACTNKCLWCLPFFQALKESLNLSDVIRNLTTNVRITLRQVGLVNNPCESQKLATVVDWQVILGEFPLHFQMSSRKKIMRRKKAGEKTTKSKEANISNNNIFMISFLFFSQSIFLIGRLKNIETWEG